MVGNLNALITEPNKDSDGDIYVIIVFMVANVFQYPASRIDTP